MRHNLSFFLGLVSVLVGLYAGSVHASDFYTIENITIRANGSNATQARQLAVAQGEKEAFYALLERMKVTLPSTIEEEEAFTEVGADEEGKEAASSEVIRDEEISLLVRGMDIKSENVARTSYIAVVDISFRPDYVMAKLDDIGAYVPKRNIRTVLVLPVEFYSPETARIDTQTGWASAWKTHSQEASASIKFEVPRAADIASAELNVMQIAGANYQGMTDPVLQTLLRRYNADEALLVMLRMQQGAAEMVAKRIGSETSTGFSQKVMALTDETQDALQSRAVRQVVTYVQNTSKHLQNAQQGDEDELTATVMIRGLADWLRVKSQLSTLPFVRTLKVLEISAGQAIVHLQFRSYQGELSVLLGEQGLYLENREGVQYLHAVDARPQERRWLGF